MGWQHFWQEVVIKITSLVGNGHQNYNFKSKWDEMLLTKHNVQIIIFVIATDTEATWDAHNSTYQED